MFGLGRVSLRDHILARLEEMNLRYDDRFEAQEKAVASALAAAKEAVNKAESATERRLEGLNELRKVVQDISSLQMPRAEAEQRIQQLVEKVDELKRDSARRGGRDTEHLEVRAQSNWSTGLLVTAGLSLLAAAIAIVIALRR
jgi:chromosome segregation ATPase